jgi:hypothetical protein
MQKSGFVAACLPLFLTPIYVGFLLGLFFHFEDGSNNHHRNDG